MIEFQSTQAIVLLGRVQPPTVGHFAIIDKMKKYCRDNGGNVVPIVVIVDGEKSSEDKDVNPLSANDRISLLKANPRMLGVKVIIAKNAFDGFLAVRKAGFEPTIIAGGSDRVNGYKEMLDKSFSKPDGSKIDHQILKGLSTRENAPQDLTQAIEDAKSNKDLAIEKISGSLARALAELGDEKALSKILGSVASARFVISKMKKASK